MTPSPTNNTLLWVVRTIFSTGLMAVGLFLAGCTPAITQMTSLSKSTSLPPDEAQTQQRRTTTRPYWCFYRYNRWKPWNLAIRSRPHLPVFAHIRPRRQWLRTYLEFSSHGPERGIFVRASASGVQVQGWLTDTRQIPIYLNRPVSVGNTVLLGSSVGLRWRGYQNKRMVLEFKPHDYATTSSLTVHMLCQHTSMLSKPASNLHTLLPTPPSNRLVWLKQLPAIPVSAVPGGEPEGHLSTRHAPRQARWLEQQGDFVKVFVSMYGYAVYGWVPTSATMTHYQPITSGLFGLLGGMGSGGLGIRAVTNHPRYICRQPTRLYVAHANQRWDIGTLGRRVVFFVLHKSGAWSTVQFSPFETWLSSAPGFQWQIPTAHLLHCRLIQSRSTR